MSKLRQQSVMVWISSQCKSKDRINKEARGTELDQGEYKPHVKEVPGPNNGDENLQGSRQPKQSHSFSVTLEEQGIHKMVNNRPACLQKCSYAIRHMTAHSGTTSSSAAAWMVTALTLPYALESPRSPSSVQEGEAVEVTPLPQARPQQLPQRGVQSCGHCPGLLLWRLTSSQDSALGR